MKTYKCYWLLKKEYRGHSLPTVETPEVTSDKNIDDVKAEVQKARIDKRYKLTNIELVNDSGPDKPAAKPQADIKTNPKRTKKGDDGGN